MNIRSLKMRLGRLQDNDKKAKKLRTERMSKN